MVILLSRMFRTLLSDRYSVFQVKTFKAKLLSIKAKLKNCNIIKLNKLHIWKIQLLHQIKSDNKLNILKI
jgi:hypothetical protein